MSDSVACVSLHLLLLRRSLETIDLSVGRPYSTARVSCRVATALQDASAVWKTVKL